jgi:abequosyltransferase
MLPEKPLLTIAIPTYNRSACLAQLLEVLLPQLIDEPRVELMISDNSSEDETAAVVQSFQEKGLKLIYKRNEINIGSDANFLQCFEQANGKYMWLVGDDDIILPGALERILPVLAARDYALVYLCPYSFRNDYMAERKPDKFHRFAQSMPNGLPFIRKVGTTIAFISAMIINKDRYGSAERPDLKSLVGSNLIHLGWLLPALGSDGTSLVVWEKLLAARAGNSGGWGICRVFGESLTEVLKVTLTGKEAIAAEMVNRTLRNWFPHMIMEMRCSKAGTLENENFRKSLEPLYRRNWRYWVYVFPVAAFPYWAARGWHAGTQFQTRAGRLLALALTYPRWHKDLIWGSR